MFKHDEVEWETIGAWNGGSAGQLQRPDDLQRRGA